MPNQRKSSVPASPNRSWPWGLIRAHLFPQHGKEKIHTPAHWWTMAAESAVLCMAALAIGTWFVPGNPFGVRAEFPWLLVVPALVAMRYGTSVGVAAVFVLIGCWLGMSEYGLLNAEETAFPQTYFLGGLVLTVVGGQFSDVWAERTRVLRAANAYLDERLQTLTKSHFLLRLSHERLEQEILTRPLTLRETLAHLHDLAAKDSRNASQSPLPGADEFLRLLAQSCQIEIGALYPATPAGMLAAEPATTLGKADRLAVDDPLVRHCLAHRALMHVQVGALTSAECQESRYLVCAPLVSSDATLFGLLAVERMPFSGLNEETLQLMTVLIGYYADGLRLGAAAADILARLPSCSPEFALDAVRLHRIAKEAGIESSLVALVFDRNDTGRDLCEHIKRLKRGIDLAWEVDSLRRYVLIVLLPLAGTDAMEGFLLRIETTLQQKFGKEFLASRLATHTARLGALLPAPTLVNLVRRCNV